MRIYGPIITPSEPQISELPVIFSHKGT